MATKRAYKLQEFIAHASDVNCVKFGKRSSRILITGGDDQKVNLWAVGKPSAILSLSGHTSPVESVSFDSSEVTIGAGAASGTIKIWDVEEAKVVRTFTGHRSSCTVLDFHPFGDFFASGSSDTNMKIWDIRKKKCMHTYKGHTRRINVLRFTPDSRWIVSGGADNSVKIWDLTAGKHLHDFRLHEGQVNCLDFHPHEFLLATGSADKTVKLWDLETFELIGSSGPENCRESIVPASVVRSMTFNSDGKALFCGLHESLKVLSWEPILCHDVVGVGWSTLADLNVHDGKLLGCSHNQSCVGIWVVDLTKIEPYAVSNAEAYFDGSASRPIQGDNTISSVFQRLSFSRSPDSEISSNTLIKRSMSSSKEFPVRASFVATKRASKTPGTSDVRLKRADSVPVLPPSLGLNSNFNDDEKRHPANVVDLAPLRISSKVDLSTSTRVFTHDSHASAAPTYGQTPNMSPYGTTKSCFVPVTQYSSTLDVGLNRSELAYAGFLRPVFEPENILKGGLAVEHGKEDGNLVLAIDSVSSNMDVETGYRTNIDDIMHEVIPETSLRVNMDHLPEIEKARQCIFQSKHINSKGKSARETSGPVDTNCFEPVCVEIVELNKVGDSFNVSGFGKTKHAIGRNPDFVSANRRGESVLSQLMESSESYTVEYEHGPPYVNNEGRQYTRKLDGSWRRFSIAGEQSTSANDEDAIADLMDNHQEFIHVAKSRLTKVEVVYRCWQNNDIKGSIGAMRRMLDYAVTADIINVLMEKSIKNITLDICTSILPLASSLLESRHDRHLNIALEMILKLVKRFGATISSTLSGPPLAGVDIEAEERYFATSCHLG